MRINFKNFGLLEFLVFISLIYVVGMLIWTAGTRPAVEAKANLVKDNHNKVVDFINNEVIPGTSINLNDFCNNLIKQFIT